MLIHTKKTWNQKRRQQSFRRSWKVLMYVTTLSPLFSLSLSLVSPLVCLLFCAGLTFDGARTVLHPRGSSALAP